MEKKNTIDWIAWVLVVVGGLNWGLALANVNLVTAILGSVPALVQLAYALVGLSALYLIGKQFM